jgi:carbon storage regulator
MARNTFRVSRPGAGGCSRNTGIEIALDRSAAARKMDRTFLSRLKTWRRLRQQQKTVRSKEGSAMLVLSRKLGEKIFINDNICITVVDIDRGKIRLGIEAPREVPIFRKELLTGDRPAPKPDTPVPVKR